MSEGEISREEGMGTGESKQLIDRTNRSAKAADSSACGLRFLHKHPPNTSRRRDLQTVIQIVQRLLAVSVASTTNCKGMASHVKRG